MNRRSTALVVTALLAIVGVGLAGALPGLGAGAQTKPAATPFPRPIVAFVPVPAAGPADPALAIQTVSAGEDTGVGSGGTRPVTVGFAGSFPLPASHYRVSVVAGVPGGAQTRASLVADGGTTSGTVETSTDGARWSDAGSTSATFDTDAATIEVPLGDEAAGRGLWVEAQVGADAAQLVRSPVFALDAVIGRNTAGALPATSWGTPGAPEASPTPAAIPVAFGDAPPTLTVDNKALVVTDPSAAPTQLAGQAVTRVVDEVTFVPEYTPSGTVSAVVQIDRTAGTVTALSGSTGLPQDRSGDRAWLAGGLPPPPASSAGAVTVTIDLQAVAQALGITLDANATGLGLRRKVTLADGSVVVGAPVTATMGWYQQASVPTEAPATLVTTAPATGGTTGTATSSAAPLVAAVGLALVLVAVALVVTSRRRRRAPQGPGSAEQALAALDAEVGDLSARVERLGRPPDEDSPTRPEP